MLEENPRGRTTEEQATSSPVERATSSQAVPGLFRHRIFRHWLAGPLLYALLFAIFFSPALASGALLAPGDGVPLFLPHFFSKKVLWDVLLFGGFPMFADPQVMMWYPVEMLFSHLPGGWNLFVISAYVLASSFMYGYVYAITESRLPAFASGLVYGMSGFMMAHLGHTGIIQSAAWIPLIIWSLEMLRRKWSPFWFAAGSLAISCCFLAGHTQIFFYSMLLGTAYAATLGWTAPVGRRRYYLHVLLLLSLGVGLAAIQIIPTAELAGYSVRKTYSFAEFITFSLPPRQLLTLLFPFVFGSDPTTPYYGEWNSTELAGYVGLLPLMLAAAGCAAERRNRLSLFWLVAGLIALLLALGDATPLARLAYFLPVNNRFRAPARHLIELTFAASVLAGLGLNAILRAKVTARLVWKTLLISVLMMLACLILMMTSNGFSVQLIADAARVGVSPLKFFPWANKSVGVPVLIFLCGAGVLAYWCNNPRSFSRSILLLFVLFIDLASYGWFYEWRFASPARSELSAPAGALDYANSLNSTRQRLLPVRGLRAPRSDMPPNVSKLWGIPSASGNNVLRLERVSHMLSMGDGGEVDPSWSEAANRSVSLMSIRYLFTPGSASVRDQNGVFWSSRDLDLWLGAGCKQDSPLSLDFDIPKPFKATRIGLVSILACSTGVPDGKEIARLSITDVNGRVQTQSLQAGRDSSEWSYDCSKVKPLMQHKKATVFDSFPAKMYDETCEGHHYVTVLRLDDATTIKSIELKWTGGTGGLVVEKLSLIDDATKSSFAVNPEYLDSSRFKLVDETTQTRVYEDLRAMPRVWLAQEALQVSRPEEALDAIKTSRLADGRDFDPARTALVEEPLSLAAPPQADTNSSAEVVSLSDTIMEVRARSASPSVLVTSDPFYPGWEATIDGQPAKLIRADYALRGVELPAGEHLVRFEFRPASFYYGAFISVLSLVGLVLIVLKALIAGRRGQLLTH